MKLRIRFLELVLAAVAVITVILSVIPLPLMLCHLFQTGPWPVALFGGGLALLRLAFLIATPLVITRFLAILQQLRASADKEAQALTI